MRKKALIISLMLVIALLSGCSAGNESTGSDNKNTGQSTEAKKPVETEPTPTSTPEPTATSVPTPTSTPEPTATSVPTPTSTPEPTATSTPAPTSTPTPKPTSIPVPTATSTPVPTVTTENPVINYEYILGNGDWGRIDEKVEIENPTGEYVNGIFVLDGFGEKFNTIVVRADNYEDVANAYKEKYTNLYIDYAGWFDDDNNGDGMLDFVMNLFVYDPIDE